MPSTHRKPLAVFMIRTESRRSGSEQSPDRPLLPQSPKEPFGCGELVVTPLPLPSEPDSEFRRSLYRALARTVRVQFKLRLACSNAQNNITIVVDGEYDTDDICGQSGVLDTVDAGGFRSSECANVSRYCPHTGRTTI